ncbi:MAG: alpha/beta hydrolase [Proteobacteria bacterium]|nr:alpha/beta hydrolase [Pseudomonadota bacterium]MBU1638857.1 alpha/beta hydrolase [Pseudomonadota bacterium]
MRKILTATTLITLIIALVPHVLLASGGPRYRVGHIAAKGLILSDAGNPYWVEYDAEGNVVKFIGEATGPLTNAWLLPGYDYRLQMAAFAEIEAKHSGHREILHRAEYEARIFKNAAGAPLTNKPKLLPSSRTVVVRSADVLYNVQDLILLQSPLDLKQAKPIADDVRSVLLNDNGIVVHTALVNIGHRVAFYTNADDDPTSDTVDMLGDGNRSLWSFRQYSDQKLWGPIEGVQVESSLGRRGTYSDGDGYYNVTYYIPPCPGFAFFYDSMMMASLKYQSFNPNAKKVYTYYATAPDNDACSGFGDVPPAYSLSGLSAQMFGMTIDMQIEGPVIFRRKNFPVDMAMLSGEADVRNLEGDALPQGSETTYAYEEQDFTPLVPQTDLDGDGQLDTATLDPQTNQVSIWLGGADPAVDPPDLTRQADFEPDFTHQGLVKQISHADLRNTDNFIYRVSNGQLFSARNGLLGSEADEPYFGDVSGSTDTTIHYRQTIRGPRQTNQYEGALEKWQARTNVNPELQGWQADHIRTGEQLKVVMINRATGYIGSSIATYGENTQQGGIISFTPEKIHMRPPNLKIKVERKNIIEAGIEAGDEKVHTIGFEGSGLTSDKVIVITTEWFDHDGTPLPEDIPGYTGRLAKVVDVNELGQASGKIANFPIQPGRNMVVVHLPQEEVDKAHYYVHVSGEAMEGEPNFSSTADFDTIGAGEGALQYRPKHYVPIRVPLYDEDLTKQAKALRYQLIAGGADPVGLPEVEPVYAWPYRPEMQFSLFDLTKVKYVDQQDTDGDNQHDLIGGDENFKIGYAEDFNFLYELLEDDLSMLEQFGPDRELVFRIGQQEVAAVTGQGLNALDFTSIDFSIIDPAELLALRLYQNGDDANVLWEYAIPVVDLDVDSDNNNGLNLPDRLPSEDELENSPSSIDASLRTIGKIMGVHKGDADGDKLPDVIDFEYHANGTEPPPGFVPMVFQIPATVDKDKAKVRFVYSASDPDGDKAIVEGETVYDTTYQLPPGHLRIWKVDNSKAARNVSDVNKTDGQFINSYSKDPSAEYDFAKLVNPAIPQENDHTVTLFVEGVRATTAPQDQKILVQVDPDGDGGSGFISADSVNVSVVEMELAVDLNRDGAVLFGEDKTDITTPYKPFRFWLNNDFDVVNDSGDINLAMTRCDAPSESGHVTCEQWDEQPAYPDEGTMPPDHTGAVPSFWDHSNVYDGFTAAPHSSNKKNIEMIECERDLEDFAPLALQAAGLPRNSNGELQLPKGWELRIRAHNVGINLFKMFGFNEQPRTGTEYLTRKYFAERQVDKEKNLYLFAARNSQEENLLYHDNGETAATFDKDGVAWLIFEGLQSSPIYDPGKNDPQDNYVEVYLTNEEQEISLAKSYINLQDVKHYYEHFTAGTGYYDEPFDVAKPVHTEKYPYLDISDREDEENYLLFVHGWRMQYFERVYFAETAFKRLYWSGYKGKFGFFSWPTGWFEKPAQLYLPEDKSALVGYVGGYEQNYDHSEEIARRSSTALANLIVSLGANKELHVFAHSMGNVVTSEALKIAIHDESSTSPVVNYAALQAATAAGSYDSSAIEMRHNTIYTEWLYLPGWLSGCDGEVDVLTAWRCYNSDSFNNADYDMPPDKYRYNLPRIHHGLDNYHKDGPDDELLRPYYFRNYDWSQKLRVLNFNNEDDAALNAWQFDQLTKPNADSFLADLNSPDRLGETLFEYNYNILITADDEDGLPLVTDVFNREDIELFWAEPDPGQRPDDATIGILSHILPSRTYSLGTRDMRVGNEGIPINLFSDYSLTASNQDHSAEFLNTYWHRKAIWDRMILGFGIGTTN